VRISDLPHPVTAVKSDWLPGTEWMGFSPKGKGPNAKAKCESTVKSQFGKGFVLERITSGFGNPRPEFKDDPRIIADREEHASMADGLLHIHKLQLSSKPLQDFVGDSEFNWLQDAWSVDGQRDRWSVAFAIVRSFEIVGAPKAKTVFPPDLWKLLFQQRSNGLRRLDEHAQSYLQNLEIIEIDAPNYLIALDLQILAAEKSEISNTDLAKMARELGKALEGETEERRKKLIRRSAKLANDFAKWRAANNLMFCEHCRFDPSIRTDLRGIKPRSCFDVHHKNPMAEGKRITTFDDLALLCPTCHRIEHIHMRLAV
jgi:5-methylcytosine-specific restriction protein A